MKTLAECQNLVVFSITSHVWFPQRVRKVQAPSDLFASFCRDTRKGPSSNLVIKNLP